MPVARDSKFLDPLSGQDATGTCSSCSDATGDHQTIPGNQGAPPRRKEVGNEKGN